MRFDVDQLDYAFPTLVRYAGLISTLVLIGFCLAGFSLQAAPGFLPAASMILYKTLHNAAKSVNKNKEEKRES